MVAVESAEFGWMRLGLLGWSLIIRSRYQKDPGSPSWFSVGDQSILIHPPARMNRKLVWI